MNISKHITTGGRNGEVVIAQAEAYSAFCQVGYCLYANSDLVNELREQMGKQSFESLKHAYDKSQDDEDSNSTVTRLDRGNGIMFTEEAALSFLDLVRVANDAPKLVNLIALNGAAAESLTGIRH